MNDIDTIETLGNEASNAAQGSEPPMDWIRGQARSSHRRRQRVRSATIGVPIVAVAVMGGLYVNQEQANETTAAANQGTTTPSSIESPTPEPAPSTTPTATISGCGVDLPSGINLFPVTGPEVQTDSDVEAATLSASTTEGEIKVNLAWPANDGTPATAPEQQNGVSFEWGWDGDSILLFLYPSDSTGFPSDAIITEAAPGDDGPPPVPDDNAIHPALWLQQEPLLEWVDQVGEECATFEYSASLNGQTWGPIAFDLRSWEENLGIFDESESATRDVDPSAIVSETVTADVAPSDSEVISCSDPDFDTEEYVPASPEYFPESLDAVERYLESSDGVYSQATDYRKIVVSETEHFYGAKFSEGPQKYISMITVQKKESSELGADSQAGDGWTVTRVISSAC